MPMIVGWSWIKWQIVPRSWTAVVKTRWSLLAPLSAIPASLPGSVPVLVALGGSLGLAIQLWILRMKSFPLGQSLLVTLIACLAGLIAAKTWYAVLNPGKPLLTAGWAVDGFMVTTPLAAFAALLASNLPIGTYFDASAPALFTAVALGRVGCFFTGCCAGRPTASRWGVWSSDRRIGAKRIPTQLIESALGLSLALVTLVLVMADVIPVSGGVFVLGLAVYLLGRQGLLRIRAEPRRFLWRRHGLRSTASQAG